MTKPSLNRKECNAKRQGRTVLATHRRRSRGSSRLHRSTLLKVRLGLIAAIVLVVGFTAILPVLRGGGTHAAAQTIPPLDLSTVSATCGPSGVGGIVTVENKGPAEASGRLRFFLASQAQQGGSWVRGSDELMSLNANVPAAGAVTLPYGPIAITGYPQGTLNVRVEAVLDVVTTGPTGATIVVWNVDAAAGSAACPVAVPAAVPGGTVYASGFAGTCSATQMVGEATISNTTRSSQSIKTVFTLAYQDGAAWIQHAGTDQVFSTTVESGGLVTIPFTFSLAGIPTDVTLVRAEIELEGIQFVAGQASRTSEVLVTGATVCPAGTPGSLTKDGLYAAVLGDSLAAISERTNSPLADMLAANGLSEGDRIYVGQTLLLPRAAVKPAATKTAAPASTRGSVAPGTPAAAANTSTRTPVVTNTPTPKATPTATASDTKTPVAAGPVSASPTTADGSPTPPVDGPANEKSLLELLLPIAVGGAGIASLGVSSFLAFVVFRRWRAGGGWGKAGAGQPAAAAAGPASSQPALAQPAPKPAVAPAAKKGGSLENPAAIPLNGELGDLLGLDRPRSQVARLFVPDPEKIDPSTAILDEARGLAGQLRQVA